MIKLIVVLVVLAVSAIFGFFAFNNFIYNEKQGKIPSQTQNTMENETQEYKITPISHATMVLTLSGVTVYTDPVGGKEVFSGHAAPEIILVTDIHGDHFNVETLTAIATSETSIFVPKAVADELPENFPGNVKVMSNGEIIEDRGIKIEAIPMYNMPESAAAPHTKGRGNGYVLEGGGMKVYVAGDTGDTPEMRALENIDVAFIPMNLPYTMNVEKAADAVLAFKPKKVIPYHYRGPDGLADTQKFEDIVSEGDPDINVELLNFYPEEN